MKHFLLTLFLLLSATFAQLDVVSGNFIRYWNYGSWLKVELQYPDTSKEVFLIPEDTVKANMAMDHFFEMMEDSLFLEDVKDSMEALYGDDAYIPDSATTYVRLGVDGNNIIKSVLAYPLQKTFREFFKSDNYLDTGVVNTSWAYYATGRRTQFYISSTGGGDIDLCPKGCTSNQPVLHLVNGDNKTSLGFEAVINTTYTIGDY